MKSRVRPAVALFTFSLAIALSFSCAKISAAEPLKIGYCTSLSGVYKSLGTDMRDGLNLYMEEIGYKAGDHDMEVIVKNIQSNVVSLALDKAWELVEKDKIAILAGVVDSGCAYRIATFATDREIPFVISNAGADDLTQRGANPFIVRISFSSISGSHCLGAWAYEQGFRKAVALGPANHAGYEQVGGMCRAFKKMGGQVVQELWTPLGTQDFKPLLAQIKPDADVAMVFFAGGDARRFVQQYAESGLKGKIAVVAKGFLVDENVLSEQGKNAEGIVSESHWSFLADNPENVKFKAAFTKKFGRPPTLYAEQGYVTGMVIAEALKKAGGHIQGKDFTSIMRSIALQAPRGTIRFDEYGAPIQNYDIRRVQLVGDRWQNAIIKSYPAVSQFWTWSPKEFMAMPRYSDMKGKWGTTKP
ncbi:MAG: ABC transporter substrate-binding protein [Desulfomonile tiedjei]|nr:ABC transporter substrate-binding protein [Desulfomonile tiedjei]